MKQILHIFRKDLRCHWAEIVASLALLAAFTWYEPRTWILRDGFRESRIQSFLYGALVVLLVLSWGLLVIRAIHSERLVGDRQYWITRPVEWKKLLAAKVLLIGVFINIPLLIAQAFLLSRAGFRLTPSSAWLLLDMQPSLVMFCLLPIAALAAVTASIAQFVLGLIAIAIYLAIGVTISSYVPSESFSSGSDNLQGVVLIVACLAALLWQYAKRQTQRARNILAAAALIVLFLLVATPYRTLVARQYPALSPSDPQPIHLELSPEKLPPSVALPDENDPEIRIPLLVSGIAEGSIVSIDGATLTLEGPNGSRWNTGWKYTSLRLFPTTPSTQMDFEVSRKFFEKIKSGDVRARIGLALTVFHDKDIREVTATEGEFPLPGVGLCSIEPGYSTNSLRCRYPFRMPSLVMKLSSSSSTCPASNPAAPQGKIARIFDGGTDAGPISPVGIGNIYFWSWDETSDAGSTPSVCVGTPLTYDFPETVQRAGQEVEIDRLHVADYRLGNSFKFATGGGIVLRVPR